MNRTRRPTPAEEGEAAARTENAANALIGSVVYFETDDGELFGLVNEINWQHADPMFGVDTFDDGRHWIWRDEITATVKQTLLDQVKRAISEAKDSVVAVGAFSGGVEIVCKAFDDGPVLDALRAAGIRIARNVHGTIEVKEGR